MTLLGSRIKELRKQFNLTQKQLGDMVSVTKLSICCYENGTRMPSLEVLGDLSDIFKVSTDYLLGRDYYIVSDNDSKYSSSISKEDLVFIKEIKKYDLIYNNLISDPKRFAELVYKKLK